jgi:hypothetical protein
MSLAGFSAFCHLIVYIYPCVAYFNNQSFWHLENISNNNPKALRERLGTHLGDAWHPGQRFGKSDGDASASIGVTGGSVGWAVKVIAWLVVLKLAY